MWHCPWVSVQQSSLRSECGFVAREPERQAESVTSIDGQALYQVLSLNSCKTTLRSVRGG